MTELTTYLTLFASSFLAATILPAQSETLLAALLYQGQHHPWLLIAIATTGNVLGACLNWTLGRYLMHYQSRRWFPVSPSAIEKYTNLYQRWGIWTVLFAWLPIIGDPLTVIAGCLRAPFPIFLIFVTIGKAMRYLAIMYLIG